MRSLGDMEKVQGSTNRLGPGKMDLRPPYVKEGAPTHPKNAEPVKDAPKVEAWIALDDIHVVMGYGRISVKKGQIITDHFTIAKLREANAAIVPADKAAEKGTYAKCPNCKCVFGV